MASCSIPFAGSTADALPLLRQRLLDDKPFAEALHRSGSTAEAARLCQEHGLPVSPEQLWRQRGTLFADGHPTWRG